MNIGNLKGTEFLHEGKKLKVTDVKVEGTTIILITEETGDTEKEVVKPVYSFSQASLDKMSKVHPKLVEVMKEAIKNSPFDFRITDGAGTAEEQNALYQIGRTRAGSIVTKADGYKNKSNHQIKSDGYGHAVDIFICGGIS